MPLPVSAQSYTQNPMTGPNAFNAGSAQSTGALNTGVSWGLGLANLSETSQSNDLRAEEFGLAQEKQDQDVLDKQDDNDRADRAEERMSDSADDLDSHRGEEIQERREDRISREGIARENRLSQERVARIRTSIAGGERAKKSLFEGVSTAYAVDGDFSGIQAEIGDPSPAGRARATNFYTQAAKNSTFLEATRSRVQEELASESVPDANERKLRQDLLTHLNAIGKVDPARKSAEKGATWIQSYHQFPVDLGKKYKLDPRKATDTTAGGYEIYEMPSEPGGTRKSVGSYIRDPGKIGEEKEFLNSWHSVNRLHDIQRETIGSIRATAQEQAAAKASLAPAADGEIPDTGTRPAQSRPPAKPLPVPQGTPSSRMGTDRNFPPQDEKPLAKQTQVELSQKRARERALRQVNSQKAWIQSKDPSYVGK